MDTARVQMSIDLLGEDRVHPNLFEAVADRITD